MSLLRFPDTREPVAKDAVSTDVVPRRPRNQAHIIFLLLAMGALLGFCGWIVAGGDGIVWSIFAGAVALALMRRVPVELFLNSMNARPLQAEDAPRLQAIFAALCQHAGLAPIPRLYRIEEAMPLAFSLDKGESAAVVIADSLLAGLTPRELCGILTHKVIHLRSGDITLKQLGFVLSWLTRVSSQLGFIFFFVGLLLHVKPSSDCHRYSFLSQRRSR